MKPQFLEQVHVALALIVYSLPAASPLRLAMPIMPLINVGERRKRTQEMNQTNRCPLGLCFPSIVFHLQQVCFVTVGPLDSHKGSRIHPNNLNKWPIIIAATLYFWWVALELLAGFGVAGF